MILVEHCDPVTGRPLPLHEVVEKHVLFTFNWCKQNVTQTAKLLKIDPKTVHTKLKGYRAQHGNLDNPRREECRTTT